MSSQEFALIVAGGSGTRFGGSVPKQFLELKGKPVLLHTLEAFYAYSKSVKVVLVLPKDDIGTWEALARKNNFNRPLSVEVGGHTRFQSVRKGLESIAGAGYVAIHDGVRPLVSVDIIRRSFAEARLHRSAVTAVRLKESLRLTTGGNGETQAVDRSHYRIIQTPQTFDVALIRQAYELPEHESLTDDASVAERAGFPIFLIEGDYRNIKITNPEDLAVAEALMTKGL